MKRALALLIVSLLGIAAACADSNDGPIGPYPQDDASTPTLPPHDADVVEASADAATDADAAPPRTCTDDGWCTIALPDAQSIGLTSYRITGLTMDGAGGVFATTSSILLAGGDSTSHVLHWEQGVWKSFFGVGPQQAGPFPYVLKAIAGNGAGSFLAVGGPASFGGGGPVVLRIDGGKVTAEYPADVQHGFVAVAFTSATDAWALDDQGTLYRASTGGGGPLAWTIEGAPHMPNPDTFTYGPTALFVSKTNELVVAGHVDSTWTDDGLVPGFTYLDRKTQDRGWVSSVSPSDLAVQFGVASDPDTFWLAAQDRLLEARVAPDGGANGGDLAWAPESDKLPVYPSAMWARGANEVWAIGAVGRVYRWDGATWADAKLALNGAPLSTSWLFAITGSPSGEMWLGGEGVALHYTPKAQP